MRVVYMVKNKTSYKGRGPHPPRERNRGYDVPEGVSTCHTHGTCINDYLRFAIRSRGAVRIAKLFAQSSVDPFKHRFQVMLDESLVAVVLQARQRTLPTHALVVRELHEGWSKTQNGNA